MSQKKSNLCTVEFKESPVKRAIDSQQSISRTVRKPGVNVNTLLASIVTTAASRVLRPVVKVDDLYLHKELKQRRRLWVTECRQRWLIRGSKAVTQNPLALTNRDERGKSLRL